MLQELLCRSGVYTYNQFREAIAVVGRHRVLPSSAVATHHPLFFFLKKKTFFWLFVGFFASLFNNFLFFYKLGCAFHGVAVEFTGSGWCQC